MAAAKSTTTRKKTTSAVKAPDLSDLLLPDWFADDYISREYSGESDLGIIDTAKQMGHNVLLYGPTGPGKTSLAMAYAASQNMPFGSIPCHGAIEERAFFGGLTSRPSKGGGSEWFWQDGIVTQIVRYGGVLLLDEVNFLHPRIGAVLHPLLDKRRQITLLNNGGETINAHKNLVVIAAYNPNYEGTRPLNEAFKNRFAFQLLMDYEPAIEEELITHSSLLVIATKLREAQKKGELETPISTNKLMEFEDIASELNFYFAVENFVQSFRMHEQAVVSEVMEMHMTRLMPDFGVNPQEEADSVLDQELIDKAKAF